MIEAMWSVVLSLSPWMLLGMAVAGVMHVMLPRDFVQRQLEGRGAVLKAVLVGVPLPLCSCGVIPAGLGLKKDGASDGAAVGFMISTPQTGIDSILVSASFLGWPFALFKVVSAAATGLLGGWIADAVTPSVSARQVAKGDAAAGRPTARQGVEHALEILRTIWRWLVVGVVVSAAIEVFVPSTFFASLAGQGRVLALLSVLVIALPLYVCATASVPIAAALVASGLPAGAALVFLMAGPATNLATVGAIYRGLGGRALAVYLSVIIAASVGLGLTFGSLLDASAAASAHEHGAAPWWALGSAAVLVGLTVWFASQDALRWLRGRGGASQVDAPLEVGVEGMTCQGCVGKLQRALDAADGVHVAQVTLQPGMVRVQGPIDEASLRDIISDTGFTPA